MASQVCLARARSADQNDVLRRLGEGNLGQRVDELAIDRRALEVEAVEVAVHGEAGSVHLVTHRAHRSIGVLGLQQVLDEPARTVQPCHSLARTRALLDQIDPGAGHAVQAQPFELHAKRCLAASIQILRRLSWTFFSTTPFSQALATLQKSASNR